LRIGLSTDAQRILSSLTEQLKSGISIEEMQSKLLDSGIELKMVKRYVSVAAGISHKQCSQCNRTYRSDVIKCPKCSRVLTS
jgi:hypothetical protein